MDQSLTGDIFHVLLRIVKDLRPSGFSSAVPTTDRPPEEPENSAGYLPASVCEN